MASVNCQPMQRLIIDVLFRGDTSGLPASFYVGLATGLLPATDGTLAGIAEIHGTGYSRVPLSRDSSGFPTVTLLNGNWKVISNTAHWAATVSDWAAADFAFLTDVASGTAGRLFAAATIDSPFLLLAGESWDGPVEWIGSP